MIVLGIDEAGYGPMLGPLVVAGSAFRVPDGVTPAAAAVRISTAFRAAGLVVGDSKVVYGAAHDVSALGRPLLALLAVSGAESSGLDELLTAVGVDPTERLLCRWYAGEPRTLACGAADVVECSAALARALAAEGAEFVGLAADVVSERRFNATLGAGNKADLLFAASAGIFERLGAQRRPGEELTAIFDRQGGRRFYSAPMQRRWPDVLVSPTSESPRRSDYRLHLPGGATYLTFEVEADGSAPQVGLASMLAKYLRESYMDLFNAYFAGLCPGAVRTAGYVEDARRWLAETRTSRTAAGVPDSDLVRVR